ncbi:MAG: TonB-dependent receptor [Acidobacteria bacterium]|nr:TonB-dependent receptor [Acidobacteriota bacterium]
MNKLGRRRFALAHLLGGILLCPVLAPEALAQRSAGTIGGTVQDSSGAFVPGATVTLTNEATNARRVFVTDGAGNFSFPSIDPGTYQCKVELTGFRTATVTGIVLGVEQTRRIDVKLAVGSLEDAVEVRGEALQVDTQTPDVSTVLSGRQAAELPTINRNFTELIALVPGALPSFGSTQDFVQGWTQGIAVTVGGGRVSSNAFTVDGVTTNNTAYGTTGVTPSVDAVQEIKVQTSFYSAESRGSSLINLAVKSGTNALHGSAYEFFRGNALQPTNPNFLNPATRQPEERPYRYDQFGGTLGGPVYIPHLYDGRDRTFFFASHESLRYRFTSPMQLVFIDDAWRTGDFSNYRDSAGNLIPIYDPLTTRPNPAFDPAKPLSTGNSRYLRTPFAGNVIPSDRIAALAAKYLEMFVPRLNPNELVGLTTHNDTTNLTVRVDHTLSNKDRLTGRYTQQAQENVSPGWMPLTGRAMNSPGKNVALVHTRVFSPRVVNEVRAAFNRTIMEYMLETSGGDRDYAREMGFQNTSTDPLDFGLPRMLFAGGLRNFGPGGSSAEINTTNTYQLYDVMTVVRGRHNLKIGADIRRDLNTVHANGVAAQPLLRFLNGYTSLPFLPVAAGQSFADFLLGYPSQAAISPIPARSHPRNWQMAFFTQNDWAVSDKATLNLGLRYEYTSSTRDRQPGGYELDLSYPGGRVLSPNEEFANRTTTPVIAFGSRPGIIKPDRNDFAPRVGIAFRPFNSDDTVVRAGYGLFYTSGADWYFWQRIKAPDLLVAPFIPLGNRVTPTIDMRDLFPPPVDLSVGGSGVLAVSALPADSRHAYSHQASVGIQHMLMRNLLLEVVVQAKEGRQLPVFLYFNQAFPAEDPLSPTPVQSRVPYANFTSNSAIICNCVSSNYRSAQVKLERQMQGGLGATLAYTWSRSRDQGSDINWVGASSNTPDNSRDLEAEWGYSSFDVRHRLVGTYLFELPFGSGRRWLNRTGFLNALAGGWQANGVVTLMSGRPWTPSLYEDVSNTGANAVAARPNLVGDPTPDGFKQTPLLWVDPAAFAKPAPGTFGDLERNALRGPRFFRWDMSIFKDFQVGKGARLQLRGEFYNLTRYFYGGTPYDQVGSPYFGKIVFDKKQMWTAIDKQIALKLIF